jgi:polyhydroxybutyrate depolymerase
MSRAFASLLPILGALCALSCSPEELFPTSYDGQRPYPLLIGFHAAGNPIEQLENLTQGSAFEQTFIRAFPKSKGWAWDYETDIGKVRAMHDDLMANYCIDLGRVFATGHSSGAQLIVQLLVASHERNAKHLGFRAVAPVAASRYGAVSRIPVLYIQGKSDSERRSSGSDVVAEFTAANACTPSSRPSALGPACTSSGRAVRAGCIEYDGCAAPTVWCSHDDPAYSNTNHGWPCFATQAMFDFFTALP